MSKQEKKTQKEASNLFHNIMKASVTPKKTKKEETKKEQPKNKS